MPPAPTAIRRLDEATVLKIAAGEVVERPSCIVKELVENALDAGATRIDLRIQSGGIDEIVVQDDGHGIPANQLGLAVTAHATSKLTQIDDLSRILTLGFRGEALASIAAVSDFSLASKARGSDQAARIDVPFGDAQRVRPDALERGTFVRVGSLFMNVPARKKFLRSAVGEKQHIERTFRRIAMLHPSVAFRFFSDGKQLFDLARTDDPTERIAQIYGRDIARHLLPIAYEDAEVKIQGLVSGKDLNFGRAHEIWLSVNQRPIQDRSLQHAILEGYRGALMERRFPFAWVDLRVDPAKVDVNIHPRKSEVRFSQGFDLFGRLSRTVERTIARPTVPVSDPESALSAASAFSPLSKGSYTTLAPTPSLFREPVAPYLVSPPVEIPQSRGFFSSLRYLSHIDHTYWILQGEDTLFVIDQHAAHERVLFERLRNRPQGLASQALLIPASVELTPSQEETLRSIQGTLASVGFDLEPFGGRTFRILSVPEFAMRKDPARLVLDLIEDAHEGEAGKSIRDANDRFVSTLACHSAVRAHDPLTEPEIRNLLRQMDDTRLSSYCPHGRPTYLAYPRSDLEKLFQRT